MFSFGRFNVLLCLIIVRTASHVLHSGLLHAKKNSSNYRVDYMFAVYDIALKVYDIC